jgi:glycerol-3-phosphate dehydrogenase
MYIREKESVDAINNQHINTRYMPKEKLLESITATTKLEEALDKSNLILGCLPTQVQADFLEKNKNLFSLETPFVSCSKGMVVKREKFMSECVHDIFNGQMKYCMLSGPSFAEEIVRKHPTCVVIASTDEKAAKYAQNVLSSKYFRTYTQSDVIGVEIVGALKNVMAIGAGIIEGLGYGYNTVSALMTRGTKEIQTFGALYHANPNTVFGLAGIGDMMLTGFGKLSRNRSFGIRIGKGESIEDILKTSGGVVEGLPTMGVILKYARERGLSLPIMEVIHDLTYGKINHHQALELLMLRELEAEYVQNPK